MKNIVILESKNTPLSEQEIEYVERKGRGHPDSLIDGIVETASIELSKYYLNKFDIILHHNVDKGLIIGGESDAVFGKGIIIRPIEIILAGRATSLFENIKIPIEEIVIKSTRDYLKKNTRFLDIDTEVIINSKIYPGSSDLNNIFLRKSEVPLANDTSFGIGFAPLTETEELSLKIEQYLNSTDYKIKMPAVGEDIKVMSVRQDDEINITLAIAFIADLVNNIEDYITQKEKVQNDVLKLAKDLTGKKINIIINNGDSYELNNVYLTKSGLSCEAGDDGSVGRGNRINGLITPFRNMTLEAASGKNPVNHVGKIYNIMANEIAKDVVKLYPQIKECNVSIVSQIGRKINDPKNVRLEIIGENTEKIKSKVIAICEEALNETKELTKNIILGKYHTF
ncbi:MAG: methionine adenosyltransferase [Candidatus Micrarchaeaceae archaeon]